MDEDLKEENLKLKAALQLASEFVQRHCYECPLFDDKSLHNCRAYDDNRKCWQIIYDWLIENRELRERD